MRIKQCALTILLMWFTASIMIADGIPLPDWAETTGSPTSAVQAIEYITAVTSLLPVEAQNELSTADTPEAQLAIVYRESIKSRLYKVERSSDTYALMKALAEIQRLLDLYKSQWEYLYQGDTTWNLDLTDSNSVGRVLAQLNTLKEFQKRLDDPDDILDGLTNYNAVFDIPGGSLIAYNEMVDCVWNGKRRRGDNLIAFLLQDCNKNGFVKGNTCFFKGKTLRMWHRDLTNSLHYTLQVHTYPACLVYIAWSYFDAAKILRTFRYYDEALALLAVEVPNIDMTGVNHMKNMLAGSICMNNGDYTNSIMHLQTALVNKDANYETIECIMKRYPGDREALWDSQMNNPFTVDDVFNEIRKGYFRSTNVWCAGLVQEALEHDWPLPSEVPTNIYTDRLLSNNIFEYKTRVIK